MARPKTDDPEARAKIIAAAEELFAERGFAGTSIRDIAQKADITGAMLHYYFGNKENLYQTILETAVAGVRSLISETAASKQPTREQLAQFIEADAAYILGHANLTRIVFREMLAGGQQITKIFQKYRVNNYAMLRGIMDEGVRRNELRPLDVALAPISLMGMLMIFQAFRPVISIALNKPTYDEEFIKRVAAHTADLFLHGAQNPAVAKAQAKKTAKATATIKTQVQNRAKKHMAAKTTAKQNPNTAKKVKR
jgi:AcrR family transcriptional regulator